MDKSAGRVGSGRVEELVNFSGSGRVTPFPGRVAKFGPACNSGVTINLDFKVTV